MDTKNREGATARTAGAAWGLPTSAATWGDATHNPAERSSPTREKVPRATRKIRFPSPGHPRPRASATILEMATGSPAVDRRNKAE